MFGTIWCYSTRVFSRPYTNARWQESTYTIHRIRMRYRTPDKRMVATTTTGLVAVIDLIECCVFAVPNTERGIVVGVVVHTHTHTHNNMSKLRLTRVRCVLPNFFSASTMKLFPFCGYLNPGDLFYYLLFAPERKTRKQQFRTNKLAWINDRIFSIRDMGSEKCTRIFTCPIKAMLYNIRFRTRTNELDLFPIDMSITTSINWLIASLMLHRN